jgi:hypothetical protein
MRRLDVPLAAAGVAVVLLLAGACGSGSPSEQASAPPAQPPADAAPPPADTAPPAPVQKPPQAAGDETKATAGMKQDPEPGAALLRFADAAGARNVDAVWDLLTQASRVRLGPSKEAFAEKYADRFRDGVGTFAGTDPEVVVTGSDGSGWGVAAIAGDRRRNDQQEFAAYGAALRLEDGAWRLELGAPITLRHLAGGSPNSLDLGIGTKEKVEAAGLWIDGYPLYAVVQGSGPDGFVVHAERLELNADRHVGVAFARAGNSASAGAFPVDAGHAA